MHIDECGIRNPHFYRPQRKFAKVMFLHLSVSHSVHGGCLPQCMLVYTPLGRHTPPSPRADPLADTPRADIPPEQTPPDRHPLESRHPPLEQTPLPWSRHPPGSRHPPCTVHAGRYGPQVGGTHSLECILVYTLLTWFLPRAYRDFYQLGCKVSAFDMVLVPVLADLHLFFLSRLQQHSSFSSSLPLHQLI